MFCPHPLKRLRVDMKRLHPSAHEEARPKKFTRKSLVEDVEDEMDEGTTEEGIEKKVFKGPSNADQKAVGGEEANNRTVSSCQNNPVLGDGENNNVQNVEGKSRMWSSRKVSGTESEATIDDPKRPRRSRRVSGSQAVILRPRRFSGDPSGVGNYVSENQRQRRYSVGESKMPKSTIDTPRRGVRPRRSLGDPARASEEVVKWARGPKTSHKPLGRPPKVIRHSQQEEHHPFVSSQRRRSLQNPRNEDGGDDMQNNNALRVKDEKSQYSCKVCGKEFTQASSLIEHNKDPKAHKRPYACPLPHCSRTFAQLQHLLNHKTRVHDDPRVEKCQNCHLQFSSHGALTYHSDLKYCNPPKQRSYLTSQTPSNCTAKFSNGKLLQLHLKLRHQEDPPDLSSFVSLQETPEEISSRCSVSGCLERSSDMPRLQEHEDCCRKRIQVTCRNCRKEFETPLDMLLHRISCEQKFDNGTKCNTQLSCPNCSRKFKADRFLQNHMKRSSCKEAFKTFICDSSNCGKMFEKPVLLRNHLYSHTDAPFHCSRERCGLSFVLLDNYRDHCKQKHDGELLLLNCDHCNDVFTLQSHLEAHKESIHKEVSYDLSIFEDLEQEELSCPFCNEKFETVSVMRVHLVGRHMPPWTCEGCGEELLSLKQTRHHFSNCKLWVVATSNMMKDGNESQDIDTTKSKDKDVDLSLQSIHCDATQEESLDAQHQSSFRRSLDDSTEGLSETLNETTVSSENILTEVKKDVMLKDNSLEIIYHLAEEKHRAKILVEAMEEKMSVAEGLEDTGDFEDDAVAVTDESLTNNIKSFNSQDDEDDENDAVEVTDNLAQCGNEKNTTELCRSEEDVSKEFEVQQEVEDNERDCLLTFTNNFENKLSDGIVIPNTSDFHHDDIALSIDVGESEHIQNPTAPEVWRPEVVERERERYLQELPAQNSTVLEALERRKQAERLHLKVVSQPGCPTTGDFAKAFGISANFIQLNVIPELLEPCEGCYPTSLTNGLAIDLLEVATARGILMQKLVTFLQQLVLPGGVAVEAEGVVEEADICTKEVAAVVARLSRVKVQAARFRTRYSQLPHYLEDYLTKYFNPFI